MVIGGVRVLLERGWRLSDRIRDPTNELTDDKLPENRNHFSLHV